MAPPRLPLSVERVVYEDERRAMLRDLDAAHRAVVRKEERVRVFAAQNQRLSRRVREVGEEWKRRVARMEDEEEARSRSRGEGLLASVRASAAMRGAQRMAEFESQRMAKVMAAMKELEEAEATLLSRLDESEREKEEMDREVRGLSEGLALLSEEKGRLEACCDTLESRLCDAESKSLDLRKEKANLSQSLSEAQERCLDLQRSLEVRESALEEERQRLSNAQIEARDAREGLERSLKQAKASLDDLQERNAELMGEMSRRGEEEESHSKRAQEAAEHAALAESKIRDQKAEIETLKEELCASHAEVQRLKKLQEENLDLERRLQEAEDYAALAESTIHEQRAEIEGLREDLSTSHSEVQRLEKGQGECSLQDDSARFQDAEDCAALAESPLREQSTEIEALKERLKDVQSERIELVKLIDNQKLEIESLKSLLSSQRSTEAVGASELQQQHLCEAGEPGNELSSQLAELKGAMASLQLSPTSDASESFRRGAKAQHALPLESSSTVPEAFSHHTFSSSSKGKVFGENKPSITISNASSSQQGDYPLPPTVRHDAMVNSWNEDAKSSFGGEASLIAVACSLLAIPEARALCSPHHLADMLQSWADGQERTKNHLKAELQRAHGRLRVMGEEVARAKSSCEDACGALVSFSSMKSEAKKAHAVASASKRQLSKVPKDILVASATIRCLEERLERQESLYRQRVEDLAAVHAAERMREARAAREQSIVVHQLTDALAMATQQSPAAFEDEDML